MAHRKCLSVLVYSLFLVGGVLMASDYCSLCQSHIACNNDGQWGSACSDDAQLIEMTPKIKATILATHNKHRNNIAGGQISGFETAAKMATIQWDNELAELAKLSAKRCILGHDACRNTDKFHYAGQNIGITANPIEMGKYPEAEFNIKDLTDTWYGEYNITTMAAINSYPKVDTPRADKRDIGHFTQLVTDRSAFVGCAASLFRSPQMKDAYALFYVCDYAVTNMRGDAVYTTGPTASKCKTGTDKKYTNLCSTEEKYVYT